LSAAVAAQTPGAEGLVALVGGEMFCTAIQALTLTSNATHQGELIALVRDILMRTTSEHDPPQQFLLSLRGVTRELFVEFKSKLASTLSQKDQRALIKKLLVHAGESDGRTVCTSVSLRAPRPHHLSNPTIWFPSMLPGSDRMRLHCTEKS